MTMNREGRGARNDRLDPRRAVRVKVVGLVWRGDALLAAEVEDSGGRVKGVRPLGGDVEYGETREQALAREYNEELGCGIEIAGPWHALENIYQHEGATGHEYIFAANVSLADPGLYARDTISFRESDESACRAGWFLPGALPPGVALYPEALLGLIQAGTIAPERSG